MVLLYKCSVNGWMDGRYCLLRPELLRWMLLFLSRWLGRGRFCKEGEGTFCFQATHVMHLTNVSRLRVYDSQINGSFYGFVRDDDGWKCSGISLCGSVFYRCSVPQSFWHRVIWEVIHIHNELCHLTGTLGWVLTALGFPCFDRCNPWLILLGSIVKFFNFTINLWLGYISRLGCWLLYWEKLSTVINYNFQSVYKMARNLHFYTYLWP